ncbi:right-handed parallel beta-helix repeat-containing protein [Aestuariirhabdus sp. Z084]|uniref:parallel beta-helix domain-containing protein n=1 Tax=Aestuariirhabdus haliotis TaxID=2918751 RepID=UPI00201B43ED|nr:parallel beta-helix domain-containing protein [Aestuariirhabdus haliotis]MCL6414908.1 right-handed parallel beta-helix repeat-containing protein [Aestuariirhabdus haliotis]MCL6418840.1 right-handed parallel beta-helix repeat-containing protein [Aestuariirhabdus haliotis]
MKRSTKWILAGVALGIFAAGNMAGRMAPQQNQAIVQVERSSAATTELKTVAQQVEQLLAARPQGKVIDVREGSSIQDAINSASPGDTIKLYPGRYHETVYIDKDNITLSGVIEAGEWPVLDGEGTRNDAILYSGNGVLIENLEITKYKGNGIMGQAGNNFVIRNNRVIDTGVYGIFPQYGRNGFVDQNVLTGIEDAAIYIGMCDNIHVSSNEVYGNVAGIEIENSRHAVVEGNYAHDNTGGILAFITPGLPIKTTNDVIIRDNFIVNNNTANFAEPGSIVANVPAGTGIIIMAADDVMIEGNVISGNKNAGIIISDMTFAENLPSDPESDPNPERIRIYDNLMYDNGAEPIAEVVAFAATQMVFDTRGPDILDTKADSNSCIHDAARYRTAGLADYGICAPGGTAEVVSYLLDKPVEPREITHSDKGKLAYYAICSGCHAYDIRLIGPKVTEIQLSYEGNPQGIVDYITKPVKRRPDYPEMPPQDYLDEEVRQAAARYMLQVSN